MYVLGTAVLVLVNSVIYPTLHITAMEWEEVMNHNSLH